MLFLEEFLSAMNITINDAASATGSSRMTVARWLKRSYDDAPLSSMLTLFEAYGYSLEFTLSRDIEKGYEEEVQWQRRNRAKFKADRLAFLTRMMLRYDISSQELAGKLNLYYTTIDHMFRANNLMISRIYRIADVCDMNVFITIKPKDLQYEEGQCYCVTNMTIVSSREEFETTKEKAKEPGRTSAVTDDDDAAACPGPEDAAAQSPVEKKRGRKKKAAGADNPSPRQASDRIETEPTGEASKKPGRKKKSETGSEPNSTKQDNA